MSTWGTLCFIMLLAVANLGLGYAIAVFLGHGPRTSPLPSLPWRFSLPAWHVLARLAELPAAPQSQPAETAEEPPQTAPDEAPEPATPQTPADDAPEPATPSEVEVDQPVDEQPAPTESFQLIPGDEPGLPLNVAMSQLRDEVSTARGDLENIDQRAQQCCDAPTYDAVEECVADLKQAGARLLKQQSQAMAVLDDCFTDTATDAGIGDNLRHAADQQAGEIRDTLERFDAWQLDPNNLDEDCRRLLAETEQMIGSCETMSQSIDEAASRMADDSAESKGAGDRPNDPQKDSPSDNQLTLEEASYAHH